MSSRDPGRPSRVLDLINDKTEWGISVSDSQSRKSVKSTLFKLVSYTFVFAAALAAIPIVVGVSLMPNATVAFQYFAVALALFAGAILMQVLSRRGPRNALQVDYAASEVRLGSVKPDGTFIRHRVCPLSQIEKVSIDRKSGDKPALCLQMATETARIEFENADDRTLTLLAAQISAARESAQKMPLKTRITSTFLGFEASAREVGQRVRSRVVSRAIS